MVDCYVGTSSNEMIQRLIILQHFSSSFSLLLFVSSSRSTPSRLSLFRMVVVACFMEKYHHIMRIKALRRSRHCWLCVPTIPAVAVDCCVFVLHCWQYSRLSLSPSLSLSLSLSLSHSGYRYLFYARTAALLVPADDRATASTFQQNDARYRLDGGLTGYHYIAKAQRHLSLHTSSCASPRWRYRWPIVLSALQSMCITLNRIITLNPTQCFAPYTTCLLPTTYYLTWLVLSCVLIIWYGRVVGGNLS